MNDLADPLADLCRQLQAQSLTAERVFLHLTHDLSALADMRKHDPAASLSLPFYRQSISCDR